MDYKTLISKAENFFKDRIKQNGSDPYDLLQHVQEANKWAKHLLERKINIDPNVIFLTVWLHDIGHYPITKESDHSITSMHIAQEFLIDNNCPKEILENTLHCIRTHRNNDWVPESKEAKLFVIIDSVSHMTDTIYLDILRDDKLNGTPFRAYKKLERDIKDVATDKELYSELKLIIEAWKNLIKAYEDIQI